MARITVEDCLKKIDSQYDLILLAKERTSQLNAGDPSLVPQDNDKNTVIALREIGEGKISIKTLEDSAINKLMKHHKETNEMEDLDDVSEDNFDKIYKGEVSKSGTAVLPSKRTRRIPEKINFIPKITDSKDEDKSEESKKPLETETLSADKKSDQ